MSIINDALKKTKQSQELIQSSQSPASRKWLVWAGITVVCLVGIFLLTNSFKSTSDNQKILPETLQQGVFNLREVDFEMPFNNSDFNLTGILYDNEKPMAIINERILTEGALVNGAELLEIQPNYVMLSLKGREVKLKVK